MSAPAEVGPPDRTDIERSEGASIATAISVAPREPFLYHGGVPGLRPGDRIVPGHPSGPGRPQLDPEEMAGLENVYVSTSRLYASCYAHLYPLGDLYRVRAVGDLELSLNDATESYTTPEAVVVAALNRAVRLTPTELERAAREHMAGWRRRQEIEATVGFTLMMSEIMNETR